MKNKQSKVCGCTRFDCCKFDLKVIDCDRVLPEKIRDNIFARMLIMLFNAITLPLNFAVAGLLWLLNKIRCFLFGCRIPCEPPHCGKPPCNQNVGLINRVADKFNYIYHRIVDSFPWNKHKATAQHVSIKNVRPKVAFVTVYNIPCGIATYADDLLKELRKTCDVHVFAEYAPGSRVNRLPKDPEWVTRCWDRNDHSRNNVVQAICDFDPDIVHVQHEYGLFPVSSQFTNLVSRLKFRGYPVLATMHSIYEHKDKFVQECAGQHILAHTHSGKQCLMDKGLAPNKITVIPHGTNIYSGTPEKPELLPKLYNTWHSDHTIYHPGFMFEYKGHLEMLDVVRKLVDKFPDTHYIVQGSTNPHTMKEHQALYEKIMEKAEKLDILDNVTVEMGFAPLEQLLSYMQTVRVITLPYTTHPGHDVRATSGIARIAMNTSTAIVTSKAHLFDDLEGYVWRAGDKDALYVAIDEIFSWDREIERQVEKRTEMLKSTSYAESARQHRDLYLKLMGSL